MIPSSTLAPSVFPEPTGAGTYDGSVVDFQAPGAPGYAQVMVGDTDGDDITLDIVIQESSNQLSWSTLATVPTLSSSSSQAFVSFFTTKRYLRARSVIAGSSPSFTYLVGLGLSGTGNWPNTNPAQGLIFPTGVNASLNTTPTDMGFNRGLCAAAQFVGTRGGADNTLATKLQESSDGATSWTDISGGSFSSVTPPDFQALEFTNTKRYLRASLTVSGTTPLFNMGLYVGGKYTPPTVPTGSILLLKGQS